MLIGFPPIKTFLSASVPKAGGQIKNFGRLCSGIGANSCECTGAGPCLVFCAGNRHSFYCGIKAIRAALWVFCLLEGRGLQQLATQGSDRPRVRGAAKANGNIRILRPADNLNLGYHY